MSPPFPNFPDNVSPILYMSLHESLLNRYEHTTDVVDLHLQIKKLLKDIISVTKGDEDGDDLIEELESFVE